MNLIVDFGNSSAKAGIFENDSLIEVADKMTLEEVGRLSKSGDFEYIFISSVSFGRDRINQVIDRMPLYLDHQTPLPFSNAYNTLETLGLDRIAAVAGAQGLFPGETSLVIDMGSCITYDVITAEGTYMGGAISPGLDMRFKAVHTFTANLPLIAYEEPISLTGKSTRDCIRTGTVFGIQAEIEGFIRWYTDKYGDLKVVLCGGSSKIFENRFKQAIFAAPDLVLRGLNRILRYNVA
jgi:type III pantothenate kinase